MIKKSPLAPVHSSARQIIPFEGMELPHSFSSPLQEITAAESNVALMDRSFYDRVLATGSDRLDLLHRISTNDLTGAGRGVPIPTVFTTEKGRVVDYVWVVSRENDCLLIASPGSAPRLISWIEQFIIMEDVVLKDISSETGMLSLVGPASRDSVTPDIPGASVFQSGDFHTEMINIIGQPELLENFWRSFEGITMGVAAFDHLRIARGIPFRDHEISDRFNPYDIGLLDSVSFTKGCYIGQEVIARLDTYHKATRSLFGIRFGEERGCPRVGSTIHAGSEEAGLLTSISNETINGERIALAVLRNDSVRNGAADVEADGVTGTVELLPMSLTTRTVQSS